MKKLLFILLFITGNLQTQSYFGQSDLAFFAGPKININILKSEDKVSRRISGGFEISAWVSERGIPRGLDFGFEIERDRVRIYADIQAGMLLGLAIGPVIEITNKRADFGFQAALWGVFMFGGEAKFRRVNSKDYFAPGFMFKVPSVSFLNSIFSSN